MRPIYSPLSTGKEEKQREEERKEGEKEKA